MTPKSPPPNLSLTAAVVVNRNSGNYGISREVNQLECSKNMKLSVQNEKNVVLNENIIEGKPCINR